MIRVWKYLESHYSALHGIHDMCSKIGSKMGGSVTPPPSQISQIITECQEEGESDHIREFLYTFLNSLILMGSSEVWGHQG